MSGCTDDIITLHAPLIHPARDIHFQPGYDNGGSPAVITDIDKTNVQFALEQYWSLVGIPIRNEIPIGDQNRVNLIYRTVFEFIPGSLVVVLSGHTLEGDQVDPDRDYDVTTTGLFAYKEFTLRLDPSKGHRLKMPPLQREPFLVHYNKRITFNTKGGT